MLSADYARWLPHPHWPAAAWSGRKTARPRTSPVSLLRATRTSG